MKRKLVLLMKGYPRLSETFIAQEILSLEKAGFDIEIIAMREPHDVAVHPVHREIRAPYWYIPEYLHDAPLRVARSLQAARSCRVSPRPGGPSAPISAVISAGTASAASARRRFWRRRCRRMPRGSMRISSTRPPASPATPA